MNTPKLPPLPEPTWPFGCKYNEKDMQAYAIAAIEAQGVPDGRIAECAKRLVEHADFKLGGCLNNSSKSKDIPSNAVSSVKARHLAALRDALASAQPAPQANSTKEQS